jgi:hypothetical protein
MSPEPIEMAWITLRKAELKRLKSELPEQEYKALKGSMWALRKEKQDLTPKSEKSCPTSFNFLLI